MLKSLKKKTGLNEDVITISITIIIALYLLFGENAQLLANFLLVFVPILFSYILIDEGVSVDVLLLHWYILYTYFSFYNIFMIKL